MDHLEYLFAGFAVFWAGLFVYLLWLQMRLRTLQRELEQLQERLEEEQPATAPREVAAPAEGPTSARTAERGV
ncbi:MAG: CcmD family protein [Dehalococcoidia bacterium]